MFRKGLAAIAIICMIEVQAQNFGLEAGVVIGTETNIDHYPGVGRRSGNMVGYALSISSYFATGDTTIHFRIAVGWERQFWQQAFAAPSESGVSLAIQQRVGTMEKRIDMLGLRPEAVFPLWKSLQGSIIGSILVPIAVKITENDSIVGHFQGTPSNPGGNYSIDKTTRTYYDGTTINLMNVGLGGGLRYDLGRVSISGSIIAHFMDLSPGSKGRAEKPKFFRFQLGYTIWRK